MVMGSSAAQLAVGQLASEPVGRPARRDTTGGVQGAAKARLPSDGDDPLAAVVKEIARRDEKALGQLYDATVGRVYGIASRITGRAEAAAEVVSDVYFQVWREAARYSPARGKVLAWLVTICRSRALDYLRRDDEAEAHPDPHALVGEAAADAADGHDLLQVFERGCAVRDAVAKLSALQRQLIALAFFKGYSHQEIAAHARLPLGSVKTHLRSALRQLRGELDERAGARQ